MESGPRTARNSDSFAANFLADYAAGRGPVNLVPADTRDVVSYDVLAVNGNVESAGAGGVSSRRGIAAGREDRQKQARASRECGHRR